MRVNPKMALVGSPFELDNPRMAWYARWIYAVPSIKYRVFSFFIESTTTRTAGGLYFTAIGGKGGREVPPSLRVEPGTQRPVWKTQSTVKPAALTYAVD